MDLLDIFLARSLTPQGSIEQYAALAQRAAVNSTTAVNNASSAVEAANAATAAVNVALESFDTDLAAAVNTELTKLALAKTTTSTEDDTTINLQLNSDNTNLSTLSNLIKLYTDTGDNTDGTMTQAAISAALSTLQSQITSASAVIDLDSGNAGQMVVVDENGGIVPSTISESNLIELLIRSNCYVAEGTVGLEIDYVNKSFTRVQEAVGQTSGSSFNRYPMYNRVKCTVANDGTILHFQGDTGYVEDGSAGQVMIYQPKFYYLRVPLSLADSEQGQVIRKEQIILSATARPGFRLHPLFYNENGEEIDYVLLSAYEGCAYHTSTSEYDLVDSSTFNSNTDQLSSIAGAKPISGVNKAFTIAAAEQMAQNRGTGWHITNFEFESALQMLELVEFGTLNGQSALEAGIVDIPQQSNYNCASITGSTANIYTGYAAVTTNEINGTYTIYNTSGRRAIAYRGMENPWGNMWRMIGNLSIRGNQNNFGGRPCWQPYGSLTEAIPLYLTNDNDWISGFGYDSYYDWTFLPIECSNANSALPVGDSVWITPNLNGTRMALVGGVWSYGDACGPFYYAFDSEATSYTRSYNARLMFIPTKNAIYTANIAAYERATEVQNT